MEAYQHYQSCKSVGIFPDDPIVRRTATIVRALEDMAERRERSELKNMILVAMGGRLHG